MSGEPVRRIDGGSKASRGRYIYAVVTESAEQALNFKGLDDRPIYTIAHRGMAAVVSDLERARIRPERRNLAAHRAVLSGLMAVEEAVLPMRFGTIAASANAIKSLLSFNRNIFESQLKQIAGKLEMGVRVVWDVPNIFEYFIDQHPDLKEARDRLFGGGNQPSQNDRIELGRMFERLHAAVRVAHCATVEEELGPLCAAIKRGTLRDDREVMNLACLVGKDRRAEFEQGVFRAATHFDN
ncbi:MAG TPA: GvpL/GvpF family gas vesicle protein, partial [Candidatus Binataceae bacterium]|nr:GvpL/GvpF family gas vesicle protein [Candidatus Binataceae bacterium]